MRRVYRYLVTSSTSVVSIEHPLQRHILYTLVQRQQEQQQLLASHSPL